MHLGHHVGRVSPEHPDSKVTFFRRSENDSCQRRLRLIDPLSHQHNIRRENIKQAVKDEWIKFAHILNIWLFLVVRCFEMNNQ